MLISHDRLLCSSLISHVPCLMSHVHVFGRLKMKRMQSRPPTECCKKRIVHRHFQRLRKSRHWKRNQKRNAWKKVGSRKTKPCGTWEETRNGMCEEWGYAPWSIEQGLSCVFVHVCIYMYICIYIYMYTRICIFIWIWRQKHLDMCT